MKKGQATTISIVVILLVLVVSFIAVFLVVYPMVNSTGRVISDNKENNQPNSTNTLVIIKEPTQSNKEASNIPISTNNPSECKQDSDCVPSLCCHAKSCVPLSKKPICENVLCTMDCAPNTLDCGQEECKCINEKCQAQQVVQASTQNNCFNIIDKIEIKQNPQYSCYKDNKMFVQIHRAENTPNLIGFLIEVQYPSGDSEIKTSSDISMLGGTFEIPGYNEERTYSFSVKQKPVKVELYPTISQDNGIKQCPLSSYFEPSLCSS